MVFKMLCFINLGEINGFTFSTIVSRIKPVQQYGQLKHVTVEMEKRWRVGDGGEPQSDGLRVRLN